MATHYNKTYASPHQLVLLLQARGLSIDNTTRVENYLRNIGYYRFSAYLYPLLETPKNKQHFKADATFDKALGMYRFDRQLRLLMFSQLEKIEVAIRSAIVNIACRETDNPFWMTEKTYFYDDEQFSKTLQLIDKELSKSREDFIAHFRNTYSDTYPPSWMLAEILPLGVLTKIYQNIRSNPIRKAIAHEFDLPKPVFKSWVTILTVTRNNCCHHARVWNRTFALHALTIRRMERPWISAETNQQKVYFSLCVIKYFLNIISPKNDLTDKINNLLSAFPNIDTKAMGFTPNWQEEPLWS